MTRLTETAAHDRLEPLQCDNREAACEQTHTCTATHLDKSCILWKGSGNSQAISYDYISRKPKLINGKFTLNDEMTLVKQQVIKLTCKIQEVPQIKIREKIQETHYQKIKYIHVNLQDIPKIYTRKII